MVVEYKNMVTVPLCNWECGDINVSMTVTLLSQWIMNSYMQMNNLR